MYALSLAIGYVWCAFTTSSYCIAITYIFNTLSPPRCIEASLYTIENIQDFFTAKGFKRQFFIQLFHEYIVIFFNLSPTSNHIYPLQGENCDSNSRLVVDEDGNGKGLTTRSQKTTYILSITKTSDWFIPSAKWPQHVYNQQNRFTVQLYLDVGLYLTQLYVMPHDRSGLVIYI